MSDAANGTTLRSAAARALVVAPREDVALLVAALEREGIPTEVVRGPAPEERPTWSRALRCLASHDDLWGRIAELPGLTLVCEADFVPVRGLGDLPLPFPALSTGEESRIGWLYNPGSILYGVDPRGFVCGHASSAVAYVLSRKCAKRCAGFLEEEVEKLSSDPYTVRDSRLGVFLRWRLGTLNHFVFAQYGEHGGPPSPEHEARGIRGWRQVSRLAGRVSILPACSGGSRARFHAIRIRARLRGAARIATCRPLRPRRIDAGQRAGRLLRFATAALLAPVAAERVRLARAARSSRTAAT